MSNKSSSFMLGLSIALLSLASGAQANQCATDVPPANSQHSCSAQASWGKCGESWMQGHCNISCGRCLNTQNSNNDPWWGGPGEPQTWQEWIALRYDGWY